MTDMTESTSHDGVARVAVMHLAASWVAAREYRRTITDLPWYETPRPHLEDLDLYGALREMDDDGYLIGTPEQVMFQIIKGGHQLTLPRYMVDPVQEIYDAAVRLLDEMGVLNQEWKEET